MSKYLTQKPITNIALDIYRQEFHEGQKERQYWVKEKEIAAAQGDRSENAEYIAAKEMIRNLDKRLRFLENILQTARVIDPTTISNQDVRFGKKIHFSNLTFIILVGSYELSIFFNAISAFSPAGKVLLGKKVGESVKIGGELLKIEKIENATINDIAQKI